VLELPYASFGNGQPSATVDITVKLSELADANQPHVISVRAASNTATTRSTIRPRTRR
jgi:hypothetical protein